MRVRFVTLALGSLSKWPILSCSSYSEHSRASYEDNPVGGHPAIDFLPDKRNRQ